MALSQALKDKIEKAEREFAQLSASISAPSVLSRPDEIRRISRAISSLEPLVSASRSLLALEKERESLARIILSEDVELAGLAREESANLSVRVDALCAAIQKLVEGRERDPDDARGVVLEVRAGTGGEEAALFAGDILRMYLRYAERKGWTCEIAERHSTELGGIREAVVLISGAGAWGRLKSEGGVHRVQRVPATESSGRIHTSAISVAVLPQAGEVDVVIRPEDVRVDTFCSSGPGGQSVNTTYSAVRVVHLPTGIVVQCQDERSQVKNKARAMKILSARLLSAREHAAEDKRGQARREQVKSGDRSDKMRTYNFPQNRVTDHKAGVTVHRLKGVLDGDLDLLLETERTGNGGNGDGGED